MGYTSVTMESIQAVKADIIKQGDRHHSLRMSNNYNEFVRFKDNRSGEYKCGCGINPHHFTINKLCPKHFKMLGELP